MVTRKDDQELIEESFEALAKARSEEEVESYRETFEELAAKVEEPGLQDKIIERYQTLGRTLLSDALPSRIDPRIAQTLRPILGDVDNVRVHSGPVASMAAQAMQARAFAIGDRDIFIDRTELDPTSLEGGKLLAHEIAHTRDAATGFALSAKHGSHTSAREQFAHEVEHKFAREWEDSGEEELISEDAQVPNGGPTGPNGLAKEPQIDKVLLAEKIMKIFEKQELIHSERHGRFF